MIQNNKTTYSSSRQHSKIPDWRLQLHR